MTSNVTTTSNFVGVLNTHNKLLTKRRVEKIMTGYKEKLPEDHVKWFQTMGQQMKINPESNIKDLILFVLEIEGVDLVEFQKRKEDRIPSAQRLPSYSTFYRWADLISKAYETSEVKIRAEVINQDVIISDDYVRRNTADIRFNIYSSLTHKKIQEIDLPVQALERILNIYQQEMNYTN